MKRAAILLSALSLLAFGCASTTPVVETTPLAASNEASGEEQGADEDPAKKLADLEQSLDVAKAQHHIAQLELESFDKGAEVKARYANAEIDMARAQLALFQEAHMPNRIASEELSLRSSRDRVQEAAEELAQIEIMYSEQDLDDLTAEFVVSRGRRNAERAQARLAIQEAEVRALEERELPHELAKLELGVDKAQSASDQNQRDTVIGREGKVLALKEKANAVTKLEAELAELREEAKQ